MFKHMFLILTATSLLLTGCSKKSSEPEEEPPAPISILYSAVRELLGADDQAGAIAMLEKAFVDPELEASRSEILAGILSITIDGGEIEAAVARHISEATDSPATAETACKLMAQRLRAPDTNTLLLEWTTKILPIAFSERTKVSIYVTHAYALVINEQTDAAIALIASCRDTLSVGASAETYKGMLRTYLSLERLDLVSDAIDKISEAGGDEPELKELVTVSRLNLFVLQQKWDDYVALFTKELPNLSDRAVLGLVNSALPKLHAAKNTAGPIYLQVINVRKADEHCVLTAARKWLDIECKAGPTRLSQSLKVLIDKGLSPKQLISLIRKPFYAVIGKGSPEQLKEMIGLVEDIKKGLVDESNVTQAGGMLLDGSFVLKDYDKTIALIQSSDIGHDEEWRASALPKVKAHRALDAGKHEEAAKHFREFMDVIEKTMTRQTDPSSGMTYTANWCLGRNAKRIGALYTEAGKKDKAAAAFTEAKAYFEDALKEFKPDSREYAAIEKEMSTPASAE